MPQVIDRGNGLSPLSREVYPSFQLRRQIVAWQERAARAPSAVTGRDRPRSQPVGGAEAPLTRQQQLIGSAMWMVIRVAVATVAAGLLMVAWRCACVTSSGRCPSTCTQVGGIERPAPVACSSR